VSRLTASLAAFLALAAAAVGPTAAAGMERSLRLIGTITGPAPHGGAVFEDAAGHQVFRRVGELVVPGVRLRAVRRGSVDLGRAEGGAAVLRLRIGQDAGPGGGGESLAAATEAIGNPVDAPWPEGAPPGRAIRHASLPRLSPVASGGRLAGLRVGGGAPDTPLIAAGLQPGDLIVAIDGRPVADLRAEALPSLTRALEEGAARPILIEAEREGVPLRTEIPPSPARR
jgi:membrane-associated protease RseP (regulator of RpoE activity)